MEVIIEETLIINLFINYLLLKLTAFLTKEKGRFLFLTALFASAISLVSPLFMLSGVAKLFLQVFTATLLILFAFKYKEFKSYLLKLAIFTLSTFVIGGACTALENIVGRFPILMVCAVGLVIFLIIEGVSKVINHRNCIKKFTYKLTFKDGDMVFDEEAYLDSGNVLYDTITKKPIILVNYAVFKRFYSDISYLSAFTKTVKSSSIKNGHYIKINSIGKGTSMLIFTIDELKVGDDKYYKNATLGLSFSGFEKSFGKNVLLHCDYS